MTPNDVKIVADNIDDFIEVPDGVDRLRKAVLTLAVSGKLLPQDTKEGTGEELYLEIQAHNLSGQKKSKAFVSTEDQNTPFPIPKSWKWVSLAEIYTSITPPDKLKSTEIVAEGKWPVVDQGEKYISGYTSSAKPIVLDTPVVIFGDHTLNVKFVDFDFVAGADGTKILKPILLDSKYFFLLIQQFKPRSRGYSRHFKQLNQKLVPLPPKNEQKRIVKKVEELMRQFDELEVKKQERDEVRTRLARSAMQSLGKGESKIAFDHLAELVKTTSDIKELENALLTLAVSGKLVTQDETEGTGQELYSKIQTEIQNSGRKRKNQETHRAIPIKLPFSIPESWSEAELGKIAYQITDGTHFTPTYIESGIPFVSIKDVSGGKLDFSNTKFISEQEHAELIKRCDPQFDDILFCRIGTLGRAVLVDTHEPFSIFVSLGLIKYPTQLISPKYLVTVLNSPCLYAQYDQIKAGGSHTNKLNLKEMPRLIIPLPPLAEQKRIVKKVEEVMDLINRLKKVMEI